MSVVISFDEVFEIQHCTNVQCVRHLHTEAEFVLVTGGTLQVLLNNRVVQLNTGDGYYLMPFEVHGYTTADHSNCTILVFSSTLVPDFSSVVANRYPQQALFRPTTAITDLCVSLDPAATYDILHKRGVLYPLCCEISDQCRFDNPDYQSEETFIRAERYIIANITERITLKSAATVLGINASYLSRMFHRIKGVEFWEYVNILRCSYAARMLTSPRTSLLSISDVAYECGFESIRTFNRVFKDHFGITPSEMRSRDLISFPNK